MDPISIIEEMIRETVDVANAIHLIPGSERLNGQLGVGTRIQVLNDVRSRLTLARIEELENKEKVR